jgi:hypothetical protein
LTLLVARVLALHADDALAAHHFALLTDLPDAGTNLHDALHSIHAADFVGGISLVSLVSLGKLAQVRRALMRPRVGSIGETSIDTRSPGITLTVVCLAAPPREAVIFVPSFKRTR